MNDFLFSFLIILSTYLRLSILLKVMRTVVGGKEVYTKYKTGE